MNWQPLKLAHDAYRAEAHVAYFLIKESLNEDFYSDEKAKNNRGKVIAEAFFGGALSDLSDKIPDEAAVATFASLSKGLKRIREYWIESIEQRGLVGELSKIGSFVSDLSHEINQCALVGSVPPEVMDHVGTLLKVCRSPAAFMPEGVLVSTPEGLSILTRHAASEINSLSLFIRGLRPVLGAEGTGSNEAGQELHQELHNAPGFSEKDIEQKWSSVPFISGGDPDLVEPFLEEVDAFISSLRDFCATGNLSLDTVRAVHSLKGSGRSAGFSRMGDLAQSMERVLRGLFEIHGTHRISRSLAESLFPSVRIALVLFEHLADLSKKGQFEWTQSESEETDRLIRIFDLFVVDSSLDSGPGIELLGIEDHTASPVSNKESRTSPTLEMDVREDVIECCSQIRALIREDASGYSAAARYTHTLVGIARSQSWHSVQSGCESLEAAFRHCQGVQVVMPQALWDEALQLLEWIERSLLGSAGDASFAIEIEQNYGGFLNRVLSLQTELLEHERPDLPERLGQDLLVDFLDEGELLIDQIDAAASEWLSEPESSRHRISQIMRNLHTIKGLANLCRLRQIASFTHEFESLVSAIDSERIPATRDALLLVRLCSDHLIEQMDLVVSMSPIPYASGLIRRIHKLLHADSGTEGTSSEAALVTRHEEGASASAPVPGSDETERGISQDTPGALLRIDPSVYAGIVEYADIRDTILDRLHDTLQAQRRVEQDFSEALERLESQIHRLDLEAQSSVAATGSRVHRGPSEEEFDLLEYDRYTAVQEISRGILETLSDIQSIRDGFREGLNRSRNLFRQQRRVGESHRSLIARGREIRVAQALMRRTVRLVSQVADPQNKKVNYQIDVKKDLQVDGRLLEMMLPMLEHLLRNAVAHGIELPEERLDSGKTEKGRITLGASIEGAQIIIRISDDGRGLNTDKIRKTGIKRGLIRESDSISDDDLYQLIFSPGFSTADQVDQVSGRGVGLDVVLSTVRQVGGMISVESSQGRGSVFTLSIPVDHSSLRGAVVRAADIPLVIPQSSVIEFLRISRTDLLNRLNAVQTQNAGAGTLDGMSQPGVEFGSISRGGHDYPILDLGAFLVGKSIQSRYPSIHPSPHPSPGSGHGLGHGLGHESQRTYFNLVLVRSGTYRAALVVDQAEEVRSVRPADLGRMTRGLTGIVGGAVISEGAVAYVLDVPEILRAEGLRSLALRQGVESLASVDPDKEGAADQAGLDWQPKILVVDDSLTLRRALEKILLRQKWSVMLARDGMEALDLIGQQRPDVVLSDVEMPRMDGFEMVSHLRRSTDENLRNLPVVMVTSRTGIKHQERGAALGVQAYLGKPVEEKTLVAAVRRCLDGDPFPEVNDEALMENLA